VSSCNNGFRVSDPGFQDDQTFTAFGGTSASGPNMAGILALIEQKLGVPQGLGNINPTLYKLASTASTYSSAFHDITTGNNDVPCTSGTTNCPTSGTLQFGYSAGTGYDQATGLGSVDANNLATAFATVATKGGTTTTIAVAPTAPVAGATVTLTATVKPTSGTTEPTGTVTFTIDGTPGTPVTVASGVAVTTTSFATGGAHTVVAAYSGDTNFYVSTSAVTNLTVTASGVSATTTTVVASPTTLAIFGALTLTATVKASAGGTVAGTVTFVTGSTTIGTANITPGASGVGTATLSVASATPALGFTAGTDTITAAYGGDSTYAASSGTTTITVTNPTIAMTATAMTISSPNPGNSGTSTITVTSMGGYSGTVDLTIGASTLNAQGGFTSSSLVVSPSSPGSTTFTVQTIAASGNDRKAPGGNLRAGMKAAVAGGMAAGCILLLLIPGIRRRRWPVAMIMLVFLGVGAGLGCGGGGSGGASPAGTYTVVLNAADSSNSAINATTTLTITIQ
jgi:Bacterial Ig-like domain (group 3)